MAEGAHIKFAKEQPRRIDRPRHGEPSGGHRPETDFHIVILVADENDKPEAHRSGVFQPTLHHIDADALPANGGHNRKRPEHETGHATDIHRPEGERTDETTLRALALKGDIAKFRDRLVALAQTLRGLGIASRPEGEVEERFDIGRVFGPFVEDFKHGHVFRTGS